MLTMIDRESVAKSQTADLSRQIDHILDRRYENSIAPAVEDKAPEVGPLSIMRTLIRGLGPKK